jgi:hypothetical protein
MAASGFLATWQLDGLHPRGGGLMMCLRWITRCVAGFLVLGFLVGCAEDPGGPRPLVPASLPPGYGDGLTGRSFTTNGIHHTLADLQSVTLQLTFDVEAATTHARAEVRFRPVDTGVPFFLFGPTATAAELDGERVRLATMHDPDNVATFTTLGKALPAGSDHVLVLDYELSSAVYSATGVDFVTAMLDVRFLEVGGAARPAFLDAYAPSSIEADQFRLSVDLQLVGASAPHRLFTNGTQHAGEPERWTIEFPDYFGTSSFYFHLTEQPLTVLEMSYRGLEGDIPITVYSVDAAVATDAMAALPAWFAELESTFGPYAHASFTANITGVGGGGMEHAGATISSVGALSHELCHSWFARGVFPADGRSGWFDEAICTWRDHGYPRVAEQLVREPSNLANLSMWYQAMPIIPHIHGEWLLREIDGLLADQGGLLPILRTFYLQWRRKVITTEQFLAFLEASAGRSFEPQFRTYVYGEL